MKRRLVLACGALAVLLLGAACGDGDDAGADSDQDPSATAAATEEIAHDRDPSPELDGPASKYSLSQPDLVEDYITTIDATFVLDATSYAEGAAAVFGTAEDGERMLTEWGYIDGYQTQYVPEGRQTAVLSGRFYVGVETHLFEDEDGAQAAYAFFEEKLTATSERVGEPQIGNEASAWTFLPNQTIGSSTVKVVYHRAMFRRGNLVAVVSSTGAEPLVEVGSAIGLAAIIDEKALGDRETIEPTPTGQTGESEEDTSGDDDTPGESEED